MELTRICCDTRESGTPAAGRNRGAGGSRKARTRTGGNDAGRGEHATERPRRRPTAAHRGRPADRRTPGARGEESGWQVVRGSVQPTPHKRADSGRTGCMVQ